MKKDMLIKKTTFEFVYDSNSISLMRPITSHDRSGRVSLGNVIVLDLNLFFKRLGLGLRNPAPRSTCGGSSQAPRAQCSGDVWVSGSVSQLSARQEESWL